MTDDAMELEFQRWPSSLAWLVRLRWLAAAGQAVAILVVQVLVALELASLALFGVVLVMASSNLALSLWLRRGPSVREWMLAAVMAFDFVLLTVLLYLSGGPSNPFTVLFLVHIALAAVVLKPRYAWMLSAMSSGCFFLLFVLPSRGGEFDAAMSMHAHHGHAGHGEMSLHLRGMWVAFAVAAAVITHVVTRVSRDLDEQRQVAAQARTRALRSERLASLATLAAGAAHELATPLGTIAVVAKELERDLSELGSPSDTQADVSLIREEVARCKHILSQMATDAGESAGEGFATVEPHLLLEMVMDDVSERERVEVRCDTSESLYVPPRAFAQAMRGLVRNALQASSGGVTLSLTWTDRHFELRVVDAGEGMPPEVLARVGEPFFTTKETGRGMGLGIFLARALVERLGGQMDIESRAGTGTSVRVVLPQVQAGPAALRKVS